MIIANLPYLTWKNVTAIKMLLSNYKEADRTIIKQEKLESNRLTKVYCNSK